MILKFFVFELKKRESGRTYGRKNEETSDKRREKMGKDGRIYGGRKGV